MLTSGRPPLRCCLRWANETWTSIWQGARDRVLIEQTYPGVEDYRAYSPRCCRSVSASTSATPSRRSQTDPGRSGCSG
uniref:glycoside hydrolase family 99-like domain-containing protein n=1 Tax=Georgenia sp. M64 TaxID=3120520 RepID=UPI00404B8418